MMKISEKQTNNDKKNTNNYESLIKYISTKRQLNGRHFIVNDAFDHSIDTITILDDNNVDPKK